MYKLQNAYYEARCKLIELGIDWGTVDEVKVNNKFGRTWGRCSYTYYSNDWQKCHYKIEISQQLLLDGSEEGLLNTMIHELLHTCKDCMNHGKRWKYLANKVNKVYGMNISRCNSAAEKGISRTQVYKYAIKCPECGKIYYRRIMCDSIKHPENYFCGKCNHLGLVSIK